MTQPSSSDDLTLSETEPTEAGTGYMGAKDSERCTAKEPLANGTIVVKIGGSTLGEHDTTLKDLVSLQRENVDVVVVHGGGKVITDWMERQNVRPTFLRGLRVTDETSVEIVTAVLTGLVNKQLVAQVTRMGSKAIGLSGADGGLVRCELQDPELGLVGRVVEVDPALLRTVADSGYLPIIAPVALHVNDGSDTSGALVNVNADTVAGEIALALGAERLVFLTDVEGVLTPSRGVISRMTIRQVRRLIGSNLVRGGMIPKLEACMTAMMGAKAAHIIDGRKPGALLDSLAGKQIGTRIT